VSYILDALKKSEKERAIGNVPTLDAVSDHPPPPKQMGGRQWLLLSIILVVGLVIAAAFVYRKEVLVGVAKFSSGGEIDQSREIANKPTAVELLPGNTPGKSKTANTAIVERGGVAPSKASENREPVNERMENNKGVSELNPVPVAQRDPKASVSALQRERMATQQSKPHISEPRSPSATADSSSKSTTQLKVISEDDLEPGFRKNVPVVNVQVVSFSENKGRRFVMIDQQIYREGDQLENGLRVEQVTRDGPLMSYKGKRFLMRPQ